MTVRFVGADRLGSRRPQAPEVRVRFVGADRLGSRRPQAPEVRVRFVGADRLGSRRPQAPEVRVRLVLSRPRSRLGLPGRAGRRVRFVRTGLRGVRVEKEQGRGGESLPHIIWRKGGNDREKLEGGGEPFHPPAFSPASLDHAVGLSGMWGTGRQRVDNVEETLFPRRLSSPNRCPSCLRIAKCPILPGKPSFTTSWTAPPRGGGGDWR